ncbi:hypothetical protein E3N88_29328 [Mikania micrantha]|uniref:BED-type domain-containing protein n=1 Tax=Mikania micrantha TaxID=192012 RepID=A0A5N6MIH8_9ASTR|nr:hypothetical protein E3N88_29328 [Mikania micrantha]
MTSVRCGGFVDPGWEHGTAQDEKKKKVRCNYCGKIVSGGIYRLKQHLARVSGEVTYCDKAPEEVCLKMKENLEGCRVGKKTKQIEYEEQTTYLNFPPCSNDNDVAEEGHHMTAAYDNRNKGKQQLVVGMGGDKGLVINMSPPPLRSLGYVDPGWEHGVPRDERKKKVKCNYCDKIVSGGINRFKQHLARIPGEVAPCKSAPEEVYLKIKENMKWHRTGRRQRRPEPHKQQPSSSSAFYMVQSEDEDEEDEQEEDDPHLLITSRDKRTRFVRREETLSDIPKPETTNAQMLVANNNHKISGRKDEVISAISKFFHHAGVPAHAANSPYFHKMLEMVVTPNTPSYEAAGKMLEEKRQNLFWTPCAASCIEQMLEDFVKIKWVAECIEKGQKITRLLYSQMWLWNLMKRECTGGQELVRASFTCNASSFVTLHNLMDHRDALKRLFQSTKWLSSRLSKSHEGEEVEKIVMNATFWKKVQHVRRSVGPILDVLQKINGGDLSMSMPYIYNDLHKAKLSIKSNHGDDLHKYGSLWSIIDNHSFSHPLYLAAYFLNPSYRYRPDFVPHPEVVRGLNSCIARFEPNNARRVSASKQISDFGSAKADFGTDLAISTRTELNPAAWWQQHGINCLELQQIAVRILSQTCSCFGCEHNYDEIHRRRHNRLAQKRLNDLIYVHYNLRLKEGQLRKKMPNISTDAMLVPENLLYEWIVKPGKHIDEELCSEMEYEQIFECEQGNGESRKGQVTDIQPLDSHRPLEYEHEDDDLNFLDDE